MSKIIFVVLLTITLVGCGEPAKAKITHPVEVIEVETIEVETIENTWESIEDTWESI